MFQPENRNLRQVGPSLRMLMPEGKRRWNDGTKERWDERTRGRMKRRAKGKGQRAECRELSVKSNGVKILQ